MIKKNFKHGANRRVWMGGGGGGGLVFTIH